MLKQAAAKYHNTTVYCEGLFAKQYVVVKTISSEITPEMTRKDRLPLQDCDVFSGNHFGSVVVLSLAIEYVMVDR